MTKKVTKKEMFAIIASAIDASLLPENVSLEDVTNFCDKQIDQLEKKSSGSRKPTAQQIQNEAYKSQILDILTAEDRPLRISEICEKAPELAEVSNQRINHLLIQLRKDGKVERTYIKKIAHFTAI